MKRQEERAKKIRAALVQLARDRNTYSINDLRVILALERIVARLAADEVLSRHLVYKGGFVLMKVLQSERFTRDLDALGLGIEKEDVLRLVPRALTKEMHDGFWFGDVKTEELDEQGEYGALRFNAAFQIGIPEPDKLKKLSRIHFDVGFGDKIPSKITPLDSSSILQNEGAISWRVYPPEYIFSEKLQTLVARGSANSRAKDVYDLALLYPHCTNKQALKKAITTTFSARETDIPASFLSYAKSIDTQQIKVSWNSVQLESGKFDFETSWANLLKVLGDLGEIF